MYPIKAKYKFTGFTLPVAANFLFGILTWTVFSNSDLSDPETWRDGTSRFLLIFTGGMQILLLFLFMTQCRFIIITETSVRFINPLLPFLVSKYDWADFDYCKSVEEYSRYQSHEAIWFIKDGKLRQRISSFYYSNYGALKRHIKTPYKGRLKMGPFKQMYCMLGGPI